MSSAPSNEEYLIQQFKNALSKYSVINVPSFTPERTAEQVFAERFKKNFESCKGECAKMGYEDAFSYIVRTETLFNLFGIKPAIELDRERSMHKILTDISENYSLYTEDVYWNIAYIKSVDELKIKPFKGKPNEIPEKEKYNHLPFPILRGKSDSGSVQIFYPTVCKSLYDKIFLQDSDAIDLFTTAVMNPDSLVDKKAKLGMYKNQKQYICKNHLTSENIEQFSRDCTTWDSSSQWVWNNFCDTAILRDIHSGMVKNNLSTDTMKGYTRFLVSCRVPFLRRRISEQLTPVFCNWLGDMKREGTLPLQRHLLDSFSTYMQRINENVDLFTRLLYPCASQENVGQIAYEMMDVNSQ